MERLALLCKILTLPVLLPPVFLFIVLGFFWSLVLGAFELGEEFFEDFRAWGT